MSYTIKEMAALSGVTVRTLRWYDQTGLVCPARDPGSGYRRYGPAEVDRLQEALLYREMGMPVKEVRALLDSPGYDRANALKAHLNALRDQRRRVDGLIAMVQDTLNKTEGGIPMEDSEKCAAFKARQAEENERCYGAEARAKYGEAAVDAGKQAMLNMTEETYRRWEALDAELRDGLARAVRAGEDPAGAEGARLAGLHLAWLRLSMGKCTPDMQAGIAAMYPEDERFRAYYDGECTGCAAFLRDAAAAAR